MGYELQEESYTRVALIILGILMIIVVFFIIDMLSGGKVTGGIVRPIVCALVYYLPGGSILGGYVPCGGVPL